LQLEPAQAGQLQVEEDATWLDVRQMRENLIT
jgi:hypothetical protein